ncbi:VCBS repeat-containing protein [Leeuwenhoekiella aestuarii]|uniref:VCBS repeat protein n=1 Tax=Leeuwenhoekiella aestuarii TaxID=2249426 RepID=A0A4V1KNT9_9FLAO|nr:VCBS repeat-containing protein [Leeuwenhoekiella aestuarii]RXG12009.1 VCBS repeat protein [Leeuwenhoekiella aestuarii]
MTFRIPIFSKILAIGLVVHFLSSCAETVEKQTAESENDFKIFESLNADGRGISFTNTLTENDSLNYFTYNYIYMGGGVAAGDINNDGLIDLYFTGNQVQNKLYLNKGDLQFEDITLPAGVGGDERWYTGVTMADVNGDGYLDIYCSVSGKFEPHINQLFINNGDNTFTEKASEYGLADAGHSIQATFFDYDKDGDLDMYQANYPPTKFSSPTWVYKQYMRDPTDLQTDHLYENTGDGFVDVTDKAGLRSYNLSLSATIGDLNNDSWPDVYVSSDFNSPDLMYINNGDGSFKEVIKEATAQTAFYGMGVDIADFNNDGLLDFFQADMDAKINRRKKANMASMNADLFWSVVDAGFHYQYMHNCMQLNNGVFNSEGIPDFSNISRITGTSSTDWSWGPLFADFDNDGLKDLFISNGTRREINDNDYFNRIEEKGGIAQDSLLFWSQNIPEEKLDNFMFQNKGDYHFEKANKYWNVSFKGFSNGGTYADLDNDGDLELVTNNIDDPASIFENKASERSNFLRVKFKGSSANTMGVGNRVYVTTGDTIQMQELTLTRGFQSSVAAVLYFGLNNTESIDEVRVVWNNGKEHKLKNTKVNQELIFEENNAAMPENTINPPQEETFFTQADSTAFPKFKHVENTYDDFKDQVLLPHKMSEFGPALAVGDVNNDGLEDYYVGGTKDEEAAFFIQTTNGINRVDLNVFQSDKGYEDVDALFFDADGDGFQDLYVVSGGYEFAKKPQLLNDRLYLNDHKGNFKAVADALPKLQSSASKVYAEDFDGDGKQDLLVLGRQTPGKYPEPASSFLLKNMGTTGNPQFEIDNEMQPEAFTDLGMATAASVSDFNQDGRADIVIVGEWMPIRFFENTTNGFVEVTNELLAEDTTGWWWSIASGDFDGDGDTDYILGNNGLNYKYKASEEEPFDIYAGDFDNNENEDIVLGYYNDGKQYPLRGRQCSSQQIPGIKKKFKDYASFSEATLDEVYSEKILNSSLHYQVKSFASIYLENKNGKMVIHQLPRAAQLSSVTGIVVKDFNNDGNLDAVLAGNLYQSEIETPRNDASRGVFLAGDGKGNFTALRPAESGLFIPGDVKNLKKYQLGDETYILAAKNSDYMQALKLN